MDILQSLGTLSGWPGLIFLILSVIFGGIYIHRASKSNANEIAKKANIEAIEALQRQVTVLNDRIKYLEELLEEAGIKH